MPTPESLATGYVELQLKEQGLQESLGRMVKEADSQGKLWEASVARYITRSIVDAESKAKKLRNTLSQAMKESRLAAARQEYGKIGGTARYLWGEHGDRATSIAKSAVGMTAAAGVGLAFSAAAAAGSTTLNTLTGSLRMLSLAAGAKTQDAVLALSFKIQKFARVVDRMHPSTVTTGVGAATGAGIGMRLGGLPGAIIGGSLGALAGTILGTKFTGDYTEDLAVKMLRDPKKMKIAEERATKLEKDAGGPLGLGEEIAGAFGGEARVKNEKRVRAGEGAKMIRDALALAKDKDFQEDHGLTAGLGFQGAFHGLADLRSQAQMGVFAGDGPLGRENMIREMNLNLQAIAENTKPQPDAQKNQANVGPPIGN